PRSGGLARQRLRSASLLAILHGSHSAIRDYHVPGNFIVKASQHPFLAGEYKAAEIPALPVGLTPKVLELKYAYKDLKPVVDAPYLVLFDNGTQNAGTLDANGEAKIPNPPGPGKVFFGHDQRDAFPY